MGLGKHMSKATKIFIAIVNGSFHVTPPTPHTHTPQPQKACITPTLSW